MKTIILAISLLISQGLFATWIPFGPDSISANKICFNIDNVNHWAICHDEGIAVYDLASQSWTNYPMEMCVTDVCYLNGSEAMIIMGDGTDSDGIYTFDPGTGNTSLIDYYESPNFIYMEYGSGKYYIGWHLGLITSTDGLNWESIGPFNNRNIVDMDTHLEHYAVSEMDNQYGVWYSDDSGISWYLSQGSPMISKLSFDHDGKLWGIFPDESWSSGLYCSDDYGITWEVKYYSVNLSSLVIDAFNQAVVGWDDNPYSYEEGVAIFDKTDSTFHFINEGLNNLIINNIILNPSMSAIALFCCTENGVFISYDYFLGISDLAEPQFDVVVAPNPTYNLLYIDFKGLPAHITPEVTACDAQGRIIQNWQLSNGANTLYFNRSKFKKGLYNLVFRSGSHTQVKKIVLN